ncbi:MAG: endopeptidase La [Defluviitaleaceae bacterium]|nr:endopeptidase La [Defluviitaleaceae bacterium]
MEKNKLTLIKIQGRVLFPKISAQIEVEITEDIFGFEEFDEEIPVFVSTKIENLENHNKNVNIDFFETGVIATIIKSTKVTDKLYRLSFIANDKARVINITKDYVDVEILEDIKDIEISEDEKAVLLNLAKSNFESYSRYSRVSAEDFEYVKNSNDISSLTYRIVYGINADVKSKQEILEDNNPLTRLKSSIILIQRELEKMLIGREILSNVKVNVEKHQKEYYLREHMKVIKEQLGEKDGDFEEYQKLINNLKADEIVKEKLNKELSKLRRIPNTSQESSIVREYLDLVLELPWGDKTTENNDIKNAENILDEDHFGLIKVKERILEFLAVRNKTNGLNAPIICLVGPPGVGKTSIAKSIAKALNRKYVRISLGGLHDESEIRGHRKTYLGSMPGRIIAAIRQAKKDNPLVLLDELDKISSSHRGDPTSALLEVLDKEQNITFRDNYVEVPYNISDILFICTANTLDGIPPALKDRLDIIQLSSYTFKEKREIANNYLIKKQIENHGIEDDFLVIENSALDDIINYYTKEAGVRQLERQIESICRKVVKKSLENNEKITINTDNLADYLGKRKFRIRKVKDVSEVGIVNGLAYTYFGGDTLSVEVNKSSGRGKLKLTGNVGKVMDESATAAFSFIRSNCSTLGINEDFYRKIDMHIHIPEGATPKDGPSAGITMATAMVSTLSNRPVKSDVAMTGEITIRGKVLPIGGLKEKVLAAKAAGIKTVLLPQDNESDLQEIEDYAKEGLDFVLVNDIHQVLEYALV